MYVVEEEGRAPTTQLWGEFQQSPRFQTQLKKDKRGAGRAGRKEEEEEAASR